MKKDKSYENWLEVGYRLFSEEGLEALQVERLAREVGLYKSGFYHYFGSREGYLKDLMALHCRNAVLISGHISRCGTFDPDLINVLLGNKTIILAHMQLVRARSVPVLLEGFENGNSIVEPYIVPLWADFMGLEKTEVAARHFALIRDTFYARLTRDTMHYDFIHALAAEARSVFYEAVKMNGLDESVQ